MSDFENGKLVAVEMRHLNPKFQIGAFNVDSIEEADQKLTNDFGDKPEWRLIESGADGKYHGNNIIEFNQ